MEINNREVAALFWLLASAIVILRVKWMREGVIALFEVIFMRRMVRWSFYMCGYLSLICYGLHMIELWSLADLKATLLWLITAGFYMVYHAVNEEPLPGKLFSETFKNGFNIAVVLEFFVGIVSLPLPVEIILLPIAAFFTFIASPSKSDGRQELRVRNFASSVLTLIGFLLILHALIANILGWSTFWQAETARQFFMPILLSFAFIPYIWGILPYLAYEHIVWRYRALPLTLEQRPYFMLKAFGAFGIRYQEVRNWWRYSIRYRPEDYTALLRSLAESKDFTTE